jgi:hypothetical protein
VLVVEMMISEERPSPAHLMDVNMLVLLPGKERTATTRRSRSSRASRVEPGHLAVSVDRLRCRERMIKSAP